MFKAALLAIGLTTAEKLNPVSSFVCQNQEVTWCYKTTKAACLDVFTQMNADTKKLMDALPDANVAKKTEILLYGGSEFNSTWVLTEDGDDLYISVLKFEQLGFLEDYQIAQTNLELFGVQDPAYTAAAGALTSQFDNTWYAVCLADKLDADFKEVPKADIKLIQ